MSMHQHQAEQDAQIVRAGPRTGIQTRAADVTSKDGADE